VKPARHLFEEYVAEPFLDLFIRVVARVGKLPRVHGIPLGVRTGEHAPQEKRLAVALSRIEQIDSRLYAKACLAWRLIIIGRLPRALAVRRHFRLRLLELSSVEIGAWPDILLVFTLAAQSARLYSWLGKQLTLDDVVPYTVTIDEYLEWFLAQVPAEELDAYEAFTAPRRAT